MANIIDLGLFVQEPLIFKDKTGELYTIPGEISTKFVVKLYNYNEEVNKLNSEEKAFEMMQQMVVDILNLDKSKKVNLEFVQERFDDFKVLKIIISEMMKHISNIANDPNSNSPKLQA